MIIQRLNKKLAFEWARLRSNPTWDEDNPREWTEVAAEAEQLHKKVHFAPLLELIYVKGSELEEDGPKRSVCGRVVVGGDHMTDEMADAALFQNLGSAPATLLGEFLDAITLFENAFGADGKPLPSEAEERVVEQSDAQQAYTQSVLGGAETWYCCL